MPIRRIAVSAAFAAGLAALPLATAKGQYDPLCSPFPLFWPFCLAGAVVGSSSTRGPEPRDRTAATCCCPWRSDDRFRGAAPHQDRSGRGRAELALCRLRARCRLDWRVFWRAFG
jgi:hypothetical protein